MSNISTDQPTDAEIEAEAKRWFREVSGWNWVDDSTPFVASLCRAHARYVLERRRPEDVEAVARVVSKAYCNTENYWRSICFINVANAVIDAYGPPPSPPQITDAELNGNCKRPGRGQWRKATMASDRNPTQEAVAWLRRRHLTTHWTGGAPDPDLARWADAIEALGREIERLRWQSVTHRMPADYEDVLVSFGMRPDVDMAHYSPSAALERPSAGGWLKSGFGGGMWMSNVTHWMPIPNLPNGNPPDTQPTADRAAEGEPK